MLVIGAPGWPRVKESFFDPHIARRFLGPILTGLWLNIRMLVVCAICALALGLLVAVLRTLRGPVFFPVRALATVYTYSFRGLPLIIVIYLFAFGVPGLRLRGTPNVTVLGGAAIVITYGAYLAEVFRAGIESVHPSQIAAARSLGLSYRQAMRHVVLPQAVRRVAPPLLNDTVALQKDVGLISLAGPIDAIRAAQISERRRRQLHAVRGSRGVVRAPGAPADPGHRLGDAAGRPPAERGVRDGAVLRVGPQDVRRPAWCSTTCRWRSASTRWWP